MSPDEDGAWIGVCNEFPLVIHVALAEADCLSGFHALVSDIAADLHANGEMLRQPLS